jgi:hypothetical protein
MFCQHALKIPQGFGLLQPYAVFPSHRSASHHSVSRNDRMMAGRMILETHSLHTSENARRRKAAGLPQSKTLTRNPVNTSYLNGHSIFEKL